MYETQAGAQTRHQETAEPPRRWIRSDVVLYVLVLIGVCAAIFYLSALVVVLELPLVVSQAALFVLLLVFGYLLYRKRLIRYRYTVTARMLSVDRLVGRRERPELSVHLTDITAIRAYPTLEDKRLKCERLYLGKKANATAVVYRAGSGSAMLLLSLSPDMKGKLIEQWKNARR